MNEQIERILKKAEDSLEAARFLADQGFFDFSASRAYYAMFYTAEALLLLRRLSFSSHTAAIANFGKDYSKSNDMDRNFHKYLIAVQDLRSQGDYNFLVSVTPNQSAEAIGWAEEFLRSVWEYIAKFAN